MYSTEDSQNQALIRLYWEKNASLTCVVLAIIVGLSAFARPIGWQLLSGTSIGGVLFYLGTFAAERHRAYIATVLSVGGLATAVWSMAISGVIRGPFMWVQGIGIFFATICACMVFAKAVRENPVR